VLVGAKFTEGSAQALYGGFGHSDRVNLQLLHYPDDVSILGIAGYHKVRQRLFGHFGSLKVTARYVRVYGSFQFKLYNNILIIAILGDALTYVKTT
jgi:hypothetical protein